MVTFKRICLSLALFFLLPNIFAQSLEEELYQKAKNSYGEKQFSQASQLFLEYINTYPQGQFVPESYCYLAELQEDFGQSIAYYNKVITEFASSPLIDDAYYQLGMTHFLLGEYETAAKDFSELLTKFPNSSWADKAQYQLGKIYLNLNALDKAKASFQKLIKEYRNSPEIPLAIMGLADCLRKEKKYDAAVKELLSLDKLYPQNELKSIAYFNLAENYRNLKNDSLAEAYYQKLIALYPASFEAEEAKKRLDKAAEISPPAKAYYSLQLGAFSQENNAKQLQKKLEAKGYSDMYIEAAKKDGKTLFLLRLGHFKNKNEAENLSPKIEEEEKLTPRLVFYSEN